MEESLRSLLLASLMSAGWLARRGKSLTVRRGARRAAPHLTGRWLDESLALLVSSGVLVSQGEDKFCAPDELHDLTELWRSWDTAKERWLRAGRHCAEIPLAEVCLRALPDILHGHRLPTDIMFPDSNMELVSAIYRNNNAFGHVNGVLAEVLSRLIQERKRLRSAAALTILEVGAGTGATTVAVLDKLAATGQSLNEYRFTDVSRLFLDDAGRRLASRVSFLQTQRFDIEISATEQGLPLAAYDFVIAANVVHATARVRVSLRNIKALLKHNGVLLLNELSAKTSFNHLTFGLLEGWWRYEDGALRIPGSPLLNPDAWVRVLGEEGFRKIAQPTAQSPGLGQQLFVAESDGFVRLASKGNLPFAPEGEWTPSRRAPDAAIREPEGGLARVADALQVGRVTSQRSDDERITDLLRQCLADAMRLPRGDVRDHTGFFEYGVDSLIAVRLINRINRALGTTLKTSVLFEHGSIAKLASRIIELRGSNGGSMAITP